MPVTTNTSSTTGTRFLTLLQSGLWLGVSILAAPAGATELLVNGDFESGDLSGWTASANVGVYGSRFGQTAYEGDYMVAMPGGAVFDASLSQTLDPAGADSATLSFAYSLQAFDVSWWGDWGTDSFSVTLGNTTVLDVSLNDAFGGYTSLTDWTVVSVAIDPLLLGNTLTVGFNVENYPTGGGDPGQYFVSYLDAVSIDATFAAPLPSPQTAPEPAGLLLFALALIFFGVAHTMRPGLRPIRRQAG